MTDSGNTAERFVRPTRVDAAFNGLVAGLTRLGVPLAGSRVLAVRGRTSGQWRTTPVNPLRVDGARYLVAPRGATHWVRNIRVAGEAELRHGSRIERVRAVEIEDAAKPPILRAYLAAWAWEVGRFFEGVDKDSSDERLAEIAPGFPVFRIESIG